VTEEVFASGSGSVDAGASSGATTRISGSLQIQSTMRFWLTTSGRSRLHLLESASGCAGTVPVLTTWSDSALSLRVNPREVVLGLVMHFLGSFVVVMVIGEALQCAQAPGCVEAKCLPGRAPDRFTPGGNPA
jgi:hypothetical protein